MENRVLFVLRADGSFEFYGNAKVCAINEELSHQMLQKSLKTKEEYETADRKVWRGYINRTKLNGGKKTSNRRRDTANT